MFSSVVSQQLVVHHSLSESRMRRKREREIHTQREREREREKKRETLLGNRFHKH